MNLQIFIDGYPLSNEIEQLLMQSNYDDRSNIMAMRRYLHLKDLYNATFDRTIKEYEVVHGAFLNADQKNYIQEKFLVAMWMHESSWQAHREGPTNDHGIPQVTGEVAAHFGYRGKLSRIPVPQQFEYGIKNYLDGIYYFKNLNLDFETRIKYSAPIYNCGTGCFEDFLNKNPDKKLNAAELFRANPGSFQEAYLNNVMKKLTWYEEHTGLIRQLEKIVENEKKMKSEILRGPDFGDAVKEGLELLKDFSYYLQV